MTVVREDGVASSGPDYAAATAYAYVSGVFRDAAAQGVRASQPLDLVWQIGHSDGEWQTRNRMDERHTGVVNGRLDGFSQERLIRYLRALGDDVEIVIHRSERYDAEGRLTVTVV